MFGSSDQSLVASMGVLEGSSVANWEKKTGALLQVAHLYGLEDLDGDTSKGSSPSLAPDSVSASHSSIFELSNSDKNFKQSHISLAPGLLRLAPSVADPLLGPYGGWISINKAEKSTFHGTARSCSLVWFKGTNLLPNDDRISICTLEEGIGFHFSIFKGNLQVDPSILEDGATLDH